MGDRLGRVGRVLNAGRALFGRVAPWAGKLAVAGTVLKFGLAAREAYAVASSTDTNERKATRFAGIAGSLAGGVIGAKVGATIGALGGPIGSAVVGVIGGALGTFVGDKALSAIASKFLGRKADETPANVEAVAKAAKAAESPAADARFGPRIDQKNTFAPVFNVKIEASDTDMANKFLAQISPQLTRMMEEQQRKAKGFKKGVDGEFLIESVEHTFASRGWITVVTLNGGNKGKAKVGHGKKKGKKIDLVVPAPK